MRTFGTLEIGREDPPTLRFMVEPHVAVRLRRLFAGVQRHDDAGTGAFELSGTPTNLIDVDWFLARYPLLVHRPGARGNARGWLADAARAHAREAEAVATLLAGHGTPRDLRLALTPRDYQLRAAEATLRTGRLLLADELGLGKTCVALAVLAAPEARPAVAIVPPHLADQWRREAAKFLPALRTLVIGHGTTPDQAADLYVVSYYRLEAWSRWLEGRVQTVIFDECFPAGTLVGGVPIEQIRIGDLVPSFDQRTGRMCQRHVLDVWESAAPAAMARLTLTDGRIIVCTPGHPFLTATGWVPAWALAPQDLVYSQHGDMSYVRRAIPADPQADGGAQIFGRAVGMQRQMSAPRAGERARAASAFCQDVYYESDATPDDQSQGGQEPARARRLASAGPWRQRLRTDGATTQAGAGPRIWLGDGVRGGRPAGATGTPAQLQMRSGAPRPADHRGGGRQSPSVADRARQGCPQGSVPDVARVARVEILECRNHAERARLCPGDRVYNLHVEDTNTYLAAGLIVHNCQELRRRGSQKYAGAKRIVTGARYRLGLSATPIYNYGGEFWNVFDVLAPGALGSREEFLAEWCGATDRTDREPRLRDARAFGAYLREHGLMVRRTKREVGRELPALSRIIETVAHDEAPLAAAAPRLRDLARRILDRDGTPFELMRAAQDLSSEARLATGCAKARGVADFVRLLVEETGDRVVLFGWHRAVYDAWAQHLDGIALAWHTGTESPAEKRRELDRFIAGDARVLIMSLRSGAGVDGLQAVCTRAVIGELDYSPGAIEQCIGRLHRDGQAAPVFAYYLLAAEGSDPAMVDTLGLKRADLTGVRDPGEAEVSVAEADPEHIRTLAAAYLGRHAERTPTTTDASA